MNPADLLLLAIGLSFGFAGGLMLACVIWALSHA